MATPPLVDWIAISRTVSKAASAYFGQELVRVLSQPPPPPEPRVVAPPRLVVEAAPEPSPLPSTGPASGAPRQGCPTCRIHRAVLAARGHVESILVFADRSGAIDPALPATLLLARQELADATTMVATYQESAPSQAAQCDATLGALDRAAAALPDPGACSVEACEAAMPALTDAMAEATTLAVGHETLVRQARGADRLRGVATRHGVDDVDAFLTEFTEELRSVP